MQVNPTKFPDALTPRLGSAVSRTGYFTLAFGAVVGSGWVVVMGDWLRAAGPGGAAIGFVAGGAVMMLIALCYGELGARSSTAGAEFLYALETLGPRAGFLVAWFITLYAVASCAFEAIACAWFIRGLIPAVNFGAAYRVAGVEVGWDAVLIGAGGTIIIGLLHAGGPRSAIVFQNIVTYGFILLTLVLMLCGVLYGSSANLHPLLGSTTGHSWVTGSLWIFATCTFFLNGWQTSLHALEERGPGVKPRDAIVSMTAAILAAALFYVAIVFAAASAAPWRSLVDRELTAAAAFGSLGLRGVLGTITLIAATISLTKTWSAMTWIGSRIIYAQACHGLLPARLARVDPRTGAPTFAIVVVMVLTLIGVMLGRGAILPIVDMVSIALALSTILCLLVLLRRRRQGLAQLPEFTVPGGRPTVITALVGAICMVSIAITWPVVVGGAKLPIEWIFLAAWAALGCVLMAIAPRLRRTVRPAISAANH